jgi:hypothetical protein
VLEDFLREAKNPNERETCADEPQSWRVYLLPRDVKMLGDNVLHVCSVCEWKCPKQASLPEPTVKDWAGLKPRAKQSPSIAFAERSRSWLATEKIVKLISRVNFERTN